MKKLEIPKFIRLATKDDVPNDPEVLQHIYEGLKAKIVEGYTLQNNPTKDLPLNFYCEININNSKLWDLFKSLMTLFPSEISLIFGNIDSEPLYGSYFSKEKVLGELNNYNKELTEDCFLEYGIIYQDENKLIEVFVKNTKYIQFWGTDRDEFLAIMNQYKLFQINDLRFIDEFPRVTESLSLHQPDVINTFELIEKFKNIFINKAGL